MMTWRQLRDGWADILEGWAASRREEWRTLEVEWGVTDDRPWTGMTRDRKAMADALCDAAEALASGIRPE